MTRCGVVGFPAAHSLSPAIHRAAYEELGLDWVYDAHEVAPGEFLDWFESLGAEWRGLSVTMPHKATAARLGDPDPDVTLTGAANTIVWHPDGGRAVHNTDIPGLVDALDEQSVDRVGVATVLGAGATARSALVALSRWGVKNVRIAARRLEAAKELAVWAGQIFRSVTPTSWPPDAEGLVVSTIPADGAAAVADRLPWSRVSAVFDISYHPWPTPLAESARLHGRPAVSGLELLVHQARHQIRLMTGRDVEPGVLRSAARNELLLRRDA